MTISFLDFATNVMSDNHTFRSGLTVSWVLQDSDAHREDANIIPAWILKRRESRHVLVAYSGDHDRLLLVDRIQGSEA